MPKIFIYPYCTGSESAKLLAEKLDAKRIKLQNSEYKHSPNNAVINWGNTNCPFEDAINPAIKLQETVDKLRLFRLMTRSGLAEHLPRYWTHKDDVPDDAFPVFCRTVTTGCDGDGIVIARDRSELVPADLYTAYVGDNTEYRVTIVKGYGVTDIQTKLPRNGQQGDSLIKTYSNGYGFQRKTVPLHIDTTLRSMAYSVLDATGLDFAGLDIVRTEDGKIYLLEVNSAMGLEGEALARFSEGIRSLIAARFPEPIEATEVPAPTGTPSLPLSSESYDEDMLRMKQAFESKDWIGLAKLAMLQI